MTKPTVYIGLINPKSPENVGATMRASGNYGVDAVFYTGERYQRAVAHNPDLPKMSRSVSQGIPLTGVTCLLDKVAPSMKIVCVEFVLNALPLPEFKHPDNVFYIFGPEDGTINQDVIDRADEVVYVPTKGCMNLSASVNVLLYDRMIKSYKHIEGNDLIIENRDTNNNTKIR